MVSTVSRIALSAVLVMAPTVCPQARAADRDPVSARISGLERQVSAAQARLSSLQVAQLYDRPSEDVPTPRPQDGDPAVPTATEDPASPGLRLDRLESQLRTLTGRIEKTEFDIRRLQDDLKKFRQDVDFRFQDQGAGHARTHRSDAGEPIAPLPAAAPARTGDAFDPATAPGAPGAPRPLGSPEDAADKPPSGSAAVEDPNAPLDLSRAATGSIPSRGRHKGGANSGLAATGLPGPETLAPEAGISPNPGSGARAEFDAAIVLLRKGEYQSAETNLQAFIDRHPRDRLVADAVYFLGETYALRGRQREAAEQFLKVSTDYSKSPRAAEGMVKLGVSLNALGAKEQACATFGEVPRKFPNASAAVRNSADRESRRARC